MTDQQYSAAYRQGYEAFKQHVQGTSAEGMKNPYEPGSKAHTHWFKGLVVGFLEHDAGSGSWGAGQQDPRIVRER